MKNYIFNGIEITEATVQKTREWYADNAKGCIEEVQSGKVQVNNPDEYFIWCEKRMKDAITGDYDNTLAFLQRAYYIQTGESVALLP